MLLWVVLERTQTFEDSVRYFLRFGSSMFGFGRKPQMSGGSKFGFAEVWPMFKARVLGDVRKFDFWVMNPSSGSSNFNQ